MTDQLVLIAVLLLLVWAASRAIYGLGFRPIIRSLPPSGFAGSIVFHLLMLPGTLVHETSHWLACKVLLVRVQEFAPYRPLPDGTLGWVLHDRADPLRGLLIAIAPVAGGTAVLAAAASYLAPPVAAVPHARSVEELGTLLVGWLPGTLVGIDWLGWRPWALIYLGMTVGRGLVPSRSDIRPVLGAVLAIPAGAAALYLAGASLPERSVAAPILQVIERAAAPEIERIATGLAAAACALALAATIAVALGVFADRASRSGLARAGCPSGAHPSRPRSSSRSSRRT